MDAFYTKITDPSCNLSGTLYKFLLELSCEEALLSEFIQAFRIQNRAEWPNLQTEQYIL
jgi:hypothetical protein